MPYSWTCSHQSIRNCAIFLGSRLGGLLVWVTRHRYNPVSFPRNPLSFCQDLMSWKGVRWKRESRRSSHELLPESSSQGGRREMACSLSSDENLTMFEYYWARRITFSLSPGFHHSPFRSPGRYSGQNKQRNRFPDGKPLPMVWEVGQTSVARPADISLFLRGCILTQPQSLWVEGGRVPFSVLCTHTQIFLAIAKSSRMNSRKWTLESVCWVPSLCPSASPPIPPDMEDCDLQRR